MKKRVKIFLALSKGLDQESLELSDLVEHLKLILELLKTGNSRTRPAFSPLIIRKLSILESICKNLKK